jgi:hypothetical protein
VIRLRRPRLRLRRPSREALLCLITLGLIVAGFHGLLPVLLILLGLMGRRAARRDRAPQPRRPARRRTR